MFRRLRRESGQALVELALAATLIFLLFSATVDLGMIFYTLQGLNNAAQEGAFYGSLLNYVDGPSEHCLPTEDHCDRDGDGVIAGDTYYSNAKTSRLKPVAAPGGGNIPNGSYYPDFKNAIRTRVVYESGNKTSGFGDYLLDLNGNDIPDDQEPDTDAIRWQYIQVSIVARESHPVTPPPDQLAKKIAEENLSETIYELESKYDTCVEPRRVGNSCFVKVRVGTLHKILFPLTPSFGREVMLYANLSVPINTSGFTQLGNVFDTIVPVSPTPTATGTIPTMTPTMTPTPNPFCTTYFSQTLGMSNPSVDTPWSQERIATLSEVVGDGYTIGSDLANQITQQIGLCSSGVQIRGSNNDFYYVFSERIGTSAQNVYFDARMTKWVHPGTFEQDGQGGLRNTAPPPAGSPGDALAGLMIRESISEDAPFVMLAYRQIDDVSGDLSFLYRRRGDTLYWITVGETVRLNGFNVNTSPLWLRLQRANPRIIGWYSTQASPAPSDWKKIGTWQDVGITNIATFGLAQASGSDTANDSRFAISAFDQVRFSPAPSAEASVKFILPENEQIVYRRVPPSTRTISYTNFHINITISGTEQLKFKEIVYTLESPAQSPKLEAASYPREWRYTTDFTCDPGTATPDNTLCSKPELLCAFGKTGSSCNPMPQSVYDDLQQRNLPYRMRVQLILADDFAMLDVPPAQSIFYIEPVSFDFSYPSRAMEEKPLVAESTHAISSAVKVRFSDPKYGIADGDGMQSIWYFVRYRDPDGKVTWYGSGRRNSDGTTSSLANAMCMFGGTYDASAPNGPFVCNSWGASGSIPLRSIPDGENIPAFEELQAGDYQLQAHALPRGAEGGPYDPIDGTSERVMALRYLRILPAAVVFARRDGDTTNTKVWQADDIPADVDLEDTAYFKFKSYVPHVGPVNGNGLDLVNLTIAKITGGSTPLDYTYDTPVYTRTVEVSTMADPWTCVFTGTPDAHSGCPPMSASIFNRLQSGLYALIVRVSNNQGKNWVEQVRVLSIAEPPVYVDFVLPDDTIPSKPVKHIGVITGEAALLIRAQAYTHKLVDANGDGLADNNGSGIASVEFQLLDPDGKVIRDGDNDYFVATNPSSQLPPDDLTELFCMFGRESPGSPCRSAGDNFYDTKLKRGNYRLIARAVSKENSAGAGRLSDPKTLTFTIPEMNVELVDPDPNPASNDGRYDAKGRKLITHREELTRFELKAYDQKYGATNYKDHFGAGILAYEFKITYDPDGKKTVMEDISGIYKLVYSDGKFDFEPTATLPGSDNLGTDYRRTYDGSHKRAMPPMCAYGEDQNNDRSEDWKGRDDDNDTKDEKVNCAPMPNDRDQYTLLKEGIYLLQARVANRAEWSPWVERRIHVPGVIVEFIKPPHDLSGSVVVSDNLQTDFHVKAYDPKMRKDYMEASRNGEGIEQVTFTLINPEGTAIFTRTIDQTKLTWVPDYYCVFGPDTGTPCLTMNDYKSGWLETLPRGTYRLKAEAKSVTGKTTETMIFEIQINKKVQVKFVRPVTTTLLIDRNSYNTDDSKFEVEAFWAKEGEKEPNGTGIREVEITLSGPGVVSPTVKTQAPYYYFSSTNFRMPVEFFRLLSGGTYILKAKATALNGDSGEATTEFQVPDYQFAFVDAQDKPLTSDIITFTRDVSAVVRIAKASGSMDSTEVSMRFEVVGYGSKEDTNAPFCLTYEQNTHFTDCVKIADAWEYHRTYTVVATAIEKTTRRIVDKRTLRFGISPDFQFDFVEPSTGTFVTTRNITFTSSSTRPVTIEVRKKSGTIELDEVEIGFHFIKPSYTTIYTDTSAPICLADKQDTSNKCQKIPNGTTNVSENGAWKKNTIYQVMAKAVMRNNKKTIGTRELTFVIEEQAQSTPTTTPVSTVTPAATVTPASTETPNATPTTVAPTETPNATPTTVAPDSTPSL